VAFSCDQRTRTTRTNLVRSSSTVTGRDGPRAEYVQRSRGYSPRYTVRRRRFENGVYERTIVFGLVAVRERQFSRTFRAHNYLSAVRRSASDRTRLNARSNHPRNVCTKLRFTASAMSTLYSAVVPSLSSDAYLGLNFVG